MASEGRGDNTLSRVLAKLVKSKKKAKDPEVTELDPESKVSINSSAGQGEGVKGVMIQDSHIPSYPDEDLVFPFLIRPPNKNGIAGILAPSELPLSEWRKSHPSTPSLPPCPRLYRGESYGSHTRTGWTDEERQAFLTMNPNGCTLSFGGTGRGQATKERALPSVFLSRGKDILVFDAGDDTQRIIQNLSHARTSKIFRIFITSLSSDCLLGLPGLLCTISSAREVGHEQTDLPIHLFGPPGLTEYVDTVLRVSNTFLQVTIITHEFSMLPPEGNNGVLKPDLVNTRAKLWRSFLPPDQLNIDGSIDGSLSSFMPNQGRAFKAKGSSYGGVLTHDTRAGFIPRPEAPSGDPSRASEINPLSFTWTINLDLEGTVVALPLQAPRPTIGYIFIESDRIGSLRMDAVDLLSVPKGPALGLLKDLIPIVTPDDVLVTPDMVLTPNKPGRKVGILGSCASLSSLVDYHSYGPSSNGPPGILYGGLDVLVAGSTRPDPSENRVLPSSMYNLLPASELGDVANKIGVRHLLLSRFDWRINGGEIERMAQEVERRLRDTGSRVSVTHDLWVHVLEKHEGREWK